VADAKFGEHYWGETDPLEMKQQFGAMHLSRGDSKVLELRYTFLKRRAKAQRGQAASALLLALIHPSA
jgi:hypothetical protein